MTWLQLKNEFPFLTSVIFKINLFSKLIRICPFWQYPFVSDPFPFLGVYFGIFQQQYRSLSAFILPSKISQAQCLLISETMWGDAVLNHFCACFILGVCSNVSRQYFLPSSSGYLPCIVLGCPGISFLMTMKASECWELDTKVRVTTLPLRLTRGRMKWLQLHEQREDQNTPAVLPTNIIY